ncbi:peptidase S41 [Pseudoalteromonas rubra]|uniref:Peptidase S41 n=1 Tax=Pseudoalteromonas rubra TaxID=43658 RepID=A0A0F4QEJ1_9GAMM|nr:peptidase S41 [Pseudoalteromonas rubra]KJZ06091.1 peptidase S41 [Pseudoalteromonas rubra]
MRQVLRGLLFTCMAAQADAALLNQAQQQAWLEDINFYARQVKTQHIQPFHTLAESDFDQMISALKAQLGALSEVQVEVRLMAISRAIGDGHCNYLMMSGKHQHFPFRFKFFGETLRVVDTIPEHRHLLGMQLREINGVSVSELYKQLPAFLPGVDNQFSKQSSFEYYLTLHKLLFGLGIVDEKSPALFRFTGEEGDVSAKISPVSMREFGKLSSAYVRSEPKLSALDIGMPGISLSLLDKSKTAYFDFASYPTPEQVMSHCDALQARLKSAGSRYLIIDFRGNRGGNFYAGLALSACLLPLDQFDWMQGVYVLSDGATFSAAMSNTVQFKQILNARVAGTPTGGDPNHFAENSVYSLPNSGRRFSLSKRYYPFSDVQSHAVYPDIKIAPSWEDYRQGKDTVLIYILSQLSYSAVFVE